MNESKTKAVSTIELSGRADRLSSSEYQLKTRRSEIKKKMKPNIYVIRTTIVKSSIGQVLSTFFRYRVSDCLSLKEGRENAQI